MDNIPSERICQRETTTKQMIPVLVLPIPGQTTERIPGEPLERFQSKQHNCDITQTSGIILVRINGPKLNNRVKPFARMLVGKSW